MSTDLSALGDRGIRYVLIAFTDLAGAPRAKMVPATRIAEVVARGAGFAGFATWLDLAPQHPDIVAMPDPAVVMPLPWKPDFAWMPADCTMDGAPLDQCPRTVLKQVLADAAAEGFTVRTGVEPEFYLLDAAGERIADALDTAEKPCYGIQALMRCHEVVTALIEGMAGLGWGPYQADHEDAAGQFEVNWTYDDALVTADRLAFFKFMLRSVAEDKGFRATMMPKPFKGITGSGLHVHLSLWDGAGGTNLFAEPAADGGPGETARHFIGGILSHVAGLTAITNPIVNSYKRLNAPRTVSGTSWAPQDASWGGDNRTVLVRVPGPGRIEIRSPDGAANPYLLPAALIAAGLDGVRRKIDPGPPATGRDRIPDASAENGRSLPANLLDALRAFQADSVLTGLLGEGFVRAYLRVKRAEWDRYAAHFSRWEWETGLDV